MTTFAESLQVRGSSPPRVAYSTVQTVQPSAPWPLFDAIGRATWKRGVEKTLEISPCPDVSTCWLRSAVLKLSALQLSDVIEREKHEGLTGLEKADKMDQV
ncbi:uncharacterized protein LOC144904222 [Branchiostoma floridae x Branchiostoma belcheri]